MKLEFEIYELTEPCGTIEFNRTNEFIKVGEYTNEIEKVSLMHGIGSEGLNLIKGLNIQESAYEVPNALIKKKSGWIYSVCYEFDIPKEFLTMKIIEEIQQLNENVKLKDEN